MQIYIHIDGQHTRQTVDDLSSAIEAWIAENDSQAVLVNSVQADDGDEPDEELDGFELGITMGIRKGRELKDALNHLNKLAKQYKCDFVVGIHDQKNDSHEDICYFGHEEGRPDLYEISSYLGIRV